MDPLVPSLPKGFSPALLKIRLFPVFGTDFHQISCPHLPAPRIPLLNSAVNAEVGKGTFPEHSQTLLTPGFSLTARRTVFSDPRVFFYIASIRRCVLPPSDRPAQRALHPAPWLVFGLPPSLVEKEHTRPRTFDVHQALCQRQHPAIFLAQFNAFYCTLALPRRPRFHGYRLDSRRADTCHFALMRSSLLPTRDLTRVFCWHAFPLPETSTPTQ